MHQLAGVLLDVDAGDADAASVGQIDVPVLAQRLVVLGDLVRLGQVGIHVIFAVHLGDGIDGAVGHQPRLDGIAHHLMIQLGQGARQADANGAAGGVGLPAEFGGAAAEYLGFGGQLHMGLQPGHHLIAPAHGHPFLSLRAARIKSPRPMRCCGRRLPPAHSARRRRAAGPRRTGGR